MSSGTGAGSAPVFLNPNEFIEVLGVLPFPNTFELYSAAFLLEGFLYGIYCVLFSICMYILIERRRFLHWILPVLATVMFAISTTDMVYTIVLHFRHTLKGRMTFQTMRPKFFLHIINNILADCTFIYRCYVVWGGDLKIIALPVLLFIASIVSGFMFEGSSSILLLFSKSWVYVLLTFVLNVILTCLTAGRIWWLSWKGKKLLDRRSQKRYHVALAAVIESGLLMACYMIPGLILTSIVLDNGFVQVVGIVPTIIVVQVGLGHAVNPSEATTQDTMEPMEVAERTTNQDEAKSHVISFYSNRQTATVLSKGEDSSGSILTYPLRPGENRIITEENVGDYREKLSQHDEESAGAGRDSETVSEARSFLRISLNVDKGEETQKPIDN